MADFVFETKIEIKIDPRWKNVESELNDVIQVAARNIESRAKQLVPRKTGATANSIEARPQGEMEWRVGPTTDYAPFLEFGTVYMKERPYLIPSAEHERPRVSKAVTELVKKLER
jgi:HK97 gp10 family phage protein|tara:strand:+ start:6847 stop:7191 length:345 start_codon:yes stop_codon:yes gene_type:complete